FFFFLVFLETLRELGHAVFFRWVPSRSWLQQRRRPTTSLAANAGLLLVSSAAGALVESLRLRRCLPLCSCGTPRSLFMHLRSLICRWEPITLLACREYYFAV
ncbi:unnamed protein product, partial [Ixodes pacificus]